MALKNEVKIGILGIVTLAVLIIGYKFLKGSNIFDRSKIYYTRFRDVEMMDASAPVLAHGLKVGTVIKVELDPKDPDWVLITMDVKSEIKLPKSAKAVLTSTGLLGGKAIALEFDHHCSDDCAENKSYLESEVASMLSSMLPKNELKDYIQFAGKELNSAFDTMTNPQARTQMALMVNNINQTIANLNVATSHLSKLLANSSDAITSSMKNIDQLTKALSGSSNEISKTISNLESITETIKKADAGKTVNNLNETLSESKKTISELQQTIEQGKKSVGQLNTILSDINSGHGSLGKLVKDQSLYNNLDQTSNNLSLLLQDLRLNPGRYVQVSVFGKKK